MEQTIHHGTEATTPANDPHRWATAPPPPSAQTAVGHERLVRNWLVVLALIVLSLSLVTALVAANQAITIWLQPQYAPFVRFTAAALVALGSLFVLLRLVRRP